MKEELRKEFEHFLGPNSHWNPSVEPSIDFIDQAIDYAIAIEHLTDGMVSARYTLAKLSEIKTIRLKDFVPGEDDSIQVNGVSVTSLDYKKIRPASINIVYQGADNRYESIIAILEEKEILLSGKLEKIGGIDFSNSVAVTKEFYTQLASYMGTTIIPHKNLSVLEVNGTTYTDPVTIGDRLFFTGKTTLKEDYYQGFTTMEYTRSTGEVTVLDYLDREICEVIAKKVTTIEEFEFAFEEALDAGRPVVLDCHIDLDDKVWPMVNPGGSISEAFDQNDLNQKEAQ